MEKLLFQVSKIVDTDRKIQEERRLRGEQFNVFSVLGLYQHEVKLHSKLIGELLNAKGSHGLKDAFLKAFIDIVNLDELDMNTASSTSQVELPIGKINEQRSEGGRIDIIVKSGEKAIIIENKIHATDQHNQLLRYYNYADRNKMEFRLIYLNLHGAPPDKQSLGNQLTEKDYTHITYRLHIKKWLERCVELSVRQPLVRETLVQYLGIVNHITNQTMDTAKQQEIIDLISNNFVSAEQIANHFDRAKYSIQSEIKRRVCEVLEEKLGDRFRITNSPDTTYAQIWIRFPKEQVPEHLFFGVESFVGNGDLFVGVFDNQRKQKLIDEELFPDHERRSEWWINCLWLKDVEDRTINMGRASLLEKLYKDNTFSNTFVEHVSSAIVAYVNQKAPQLIAYFNR